MAERLEVIKTYKLFIDGKFPRSESGRTLVMRDQRARGGERVFAHTCHASRKDLRDAVVAARKALQGWRGSTAYLRGQILYRIAEMMEGKRAELAEAIAVGRSATKSKNRAGVSPESEVTAAIDRLVGYAGWADKYQQVLGCNNPVAGPYYNFTAPEPTGVIGLIAPDEPSLLGLVSLLAPAICPGNAVVVVAGERNPIPAAVLGEVIATSDVPSGVVNILTGPRAELAPVLAAHRDVDGIVAADVDEAQHRVLREGAAENVKRVRLLKGVDWYDQTACQNPWWIESMVEMKTIWHPSAV